MLRVMAKIGRLTNTSCTFLHFLVIVWDHKISSGKWDVNEWDTCYFYVKA